MCFWKTLKLILCISFMIYVDLSGFWIKFDLFFKTVTFHFWSIESIARLIEIATKILVWIFLARLVLDWCSIDQIYFSIDRSSILTNQISKDECFKKVFSPVLHYFQIFSNTFLTFSPWPIQTKNFFSFSSTNLSKISVFKH